MSLDQKSVLIDNDFICHIIETKMDIETISAKLKEAFTIIERYAFMHPLVFEKELPDAYKTLTIFSDNIVTKTEFSDIHDDDSGKMQYYVYLVRELYFAITGIKLSFSNNEIFTRWERNKNLGEVHSMSTCLLCRSGLFLSDDNDSKRIQEYIHGKAMGKIDVLNRKEFFDLYKSCGGTKISRMDKRKLSHE